MRGGFFLSSLISRGGHRRIPVWRVRINIVMVSSPFLTDSFSIKMCANVQYLARALYSFFAIGDLRLSPFC